MTTSKAIRRADKFFSLLIRDRDPICVRCREQRSAHCAHNFGRGYMQTRVDFDNAVGLCAGCHMYLTHNPHEHVEFFRDRLGADQYDDLMARAYAGRGMKSPRGFWEDKATELRQQCATRGL